MQPSVSYSLQPLPMWYPLAECRRRLVMQGTALSAIVNGDEIGTQWACGNCTVVATCYDYFDGCHHWIYLLGGDGKVVDQLSMPDHFGFVQNVEVVSDNEIAFGYFGTNDRYNLVVCEPAFWSYAPAALLRRPNRFLLAKRHLKLRRTKGAPWSLPPAPSPPVGSASDARRTAAHLKS